MATAVDASALLGSLVGSRGLEESDVIVRVGRRVSVQVPYSPCTPYSIPSPRPAEDPAGAAMSPQSDVTAGTDQHVASPWHVISGIPRVNSFVVDAEKDSSAGPLRKGPFPVHSPRGSPTGQDGQTFSPGAGRGTPPPSRPREVVGSVDLVPSYGGGGGTHAFCSVHSPSREFDSYASDLAGRPLSAAATPPAQDAGVLRNVASLLADLEKPPPPKAALKAAPSPTAKGKAAKIAMQERPPAVSPLGKELEAMNERLERELVQRKRELSRAKKQQAEHKPRSSSLVKFKSIVSFLSFRKKAGGILRRDSTAGHTPGGALRPRSSSPARMAPQEIVQKEDLRSEVVLDDLMEPLRPPNTRLEPPHPEIDRMYAMRHLLQRPNRFIQPTSPTSTVTTAMTGVRTMRASAFEGSDPPAGAGGAARGPPSTPAPGAGGHAQGSVSTASSAAELAATADEVFSTLDVSGAGVLSYEDVRAFYRAVAPSEPEVKVRLAVRAVAQRDDLAVRKKELLRLVGLMEFALGMPASVMIQQFRVACFDGISTVLHTDSHGHNLSVHQISAHVRALQMDCAQTPALRRRDLALTRGDEALRIFLKEVAAQQQGDAEAEGTLTRAQFVTFVTRIALDIPVPYVVKAFFRGKDDDMPKKRAALCKVLTAVQAAAPAGKA
eukprot:TRINITY_DN6244_c0_g1_i1.p1 TRINITY_DN6244_c0_g1~~TRINITY_DN6244_c0_g1_i1.p1  ORF type:complete len:679 (+),score=262.59 TRINITY_DN6244_c0_g1_i1:45-2039(+)